jgi:hypothetical protein
MNLPSGLKTIHWTLVHDYMYVPVELENSINAIPELIPVE